MVGVFYRSASPSSPPFVEEGARVEVGQTLCILEAMKLFNEFKSDHAGVVKRIAVRNADPVEYGQLAVRARLSLCSAACSSPTGARSPCG